MFPASPGFVTQNGLLAWQATVFDYRGRASQAVRRLKYDRRTSLAQKMSQCLYDRYNEIGEAVDAVVPVPIHWSRRCQRGFNQSDLLCESFPREMVRPDLLRRVRATRPQVGLSHQERLENLTGAFRASAAAAGLTILLVDDVLTSGQTARECATALKDAGAAEVAILAFAGEAV
jgi:ComF family protein